MRHFDARQVAEQHAMRVQRALRRTGGAGGVDHHRRIVGERVFRRECVGRLLQQRVESERAVGLAVDRHDQRQTGSAVAEPIELCQALRIGDQHLGAGILQPVGERFRPEQQRERQRHRRKLVDRDMRGHGLGRLRQQDRDPVAALDAVRAQRIGEPVGLRPQRAIADIVDAAVGMDMNDRGAAGLAHSPAVADIHADIVAIGDRPAKFAVQLFVVVYLWKHPACPARNLVGANGLRPVTEAHEATKRMNPSEAPRWRAMTQSDLADGGGPGHPHPPEFSGTAGSAVRKIQAVSGWLFHACRFERHPRLLLFASLGRRAAFARHVSRCAAASVPTAISSTI